MVWLTGRRLAPAADPHRQSDDTVGSVARTVVRGGPFVFGAAFERVRGQSPRESHDGIRARTATAPPRGAGRRLRTRVRRRR
ncbi:hypothetical protein [Streptomyces halstedii]|uniref:hypothetical protein n=1 Tax=Streptomyces halstedii TaxID=1944 RepID=UPI003802DAA8